MQTASLCKKRVKGMNRLFFFSLLIIGAFSCKKELNNAELKEMLTIYNQSYKGKSDNFEERYAMYSAAYLETFEEEVNKAITLDSQGVAQLPPPQQLRILGLKNALPKSLLLSGDMKAILRAWDIPGRRNFPLAYTADRIYTPKPEMETKMYEGGAKLVLIRFVEQDGKYKIDPLNTDAVQMKRHENLRKKYSFESLSKYAAYANFSDSRPVSWAPLN